MKTYMDDMHRVRNADIDIKRTNCWREKHWTEGREKESEGGGGGLMIEAQDQNLPTRNYWENNFKNRIKYFGRADKKNWIKW